MPKKAAAAAAAPTAAGAAIAAAAPVAVEENVKVAVRIRPFNKREIDRKANLCVQMKGNVTTVSDAQGKPRSFTYDHSYWSFDGGKELSDGYVEPDLSHPNGKNFCDQKRCYSDLGKGIIKNAWGGYNATLFAYGQTGSGKSWSVIGYGTNKGIVPMVCEELFEGIKANTEPKEFEVKLSMLEIYNEIVRDLLSTKQSKAGLKIRQHPKKGFYAEGLRQPLVTSHSDIAAKMEEGTVNRTIRSTNMNATSSRAHTIVTVTFIQKFKNQRGQETAKTAVINLVDLAGSERVESTGATGDRLKEGAAINLSLTCLGNCINALVKQGQGESARIPFRDSSLTKLLKNALGGNSKTVMIAAISPADINYDETISTLNFADRAKQIKTKAIVNEDPTEKLIRELMEENERLKKGLATGKVDASMIDLDGDGIDDRVDATALKKKWEEEMKARMLENDLQVSNMMKTYEEKLKLAKRDLSDPTIPKKELEKTKKPHIFNLNSDPQLSGKIIHILKGGTTTIGNRKGQESDITMIGPSMQENHATITVEKNGTVNLKPCSDDCRVLINGSSIKGKIAIQHNDRLVFGSTQVWVFQNPMQTGKSKKKQPIITYEFAQEEITAKSGIDMNNLPPETDMAALQQELQELVPSVEEANSISEDLDRKAKFEIVLLSPQMVGKASGKTEFHVKLRNLENGTEYMWTKKMFMDRLYKMREMYNNYEDEDDWDLDEENDPFQESLDTEVQIGVVQFILQPLAHMVELKEQLEILSIKGTEVGVMNVEVVPCNKAGREYTEKDDAFVDNPDQLIGRDLYFKFKILNCRGLPNRYSEVYCNYQFYLDKEEHKTKAISDTTNPNFKYEKNFTFRPVTKQFIDYLMNTSIAIKVMGKQRIRRSAIPLNQGLSTRDMLKNDRTVFAKTAALMNGFQMNGRVVDPQKQSIIVELLLMKKTQARLQQRCDNVSKLIKEAENTSRLRVSTTLLREVMNANSPEQADAIIRKKLSDESDKHNDGSGSFKSSVCTMI